MGSIRRGTIERHSPRRTRWLHSAREKHGRGRHATADKCSTCLLHLHRQWRRVRQTVEETGATLALLPQSTCYCSQKGWNLTSDGATRWRRCAWTRKRKRGASGPDWQGVCLCVCVYELGDERGGRGKGGDWGLIDIYVGIFFFKSLFTNIALVTKIQPFCRKKKHVQVVTNAECRWESCADSQWSEVTCKNHMGI